MSDERRHDSWSDAFSDFMAIYMTFCAHPIRVIFADPPLDLLVPLTAVDHDARFLESVERGQQNTTLRDEFEQFKQLSAQQQRSAVRAVTRSSRYADKISGA